MKSLISVDRLRLLLSRLHERLWVKPLAICLLSVGAAFGAKLADDTGLARFVPEIAPDSIETLLSVMASSMMVIATLSVASMVSAYASASNTVTPRSFTLVVADDLSQNALTTFVGAFIFAIVALAAFKNNYFGAAGIFVLFLQIVIVFGVIIITFVRWVDRIARLGRMGSTIEKVEKATADALQRRRDAPNLGGVPALSHAGIRSQSGGRAVYATSVGYVQNIDIDALQRWAKHADVRVIVAALPGTFAAPGRALAHVIATQGNHNDIDYKCVAEAFKIGFDRRFDDDPRFGLVVLSEIASRTLSPAVNDPGTAFSVVGTLIRLFTLWNEPATQDNDQTPTCDRVEVPELCVRDMFDDAFTGIGRDGARMVEVSVRLQKALGCLALIGDAEMREAAEHHALLALKRASLALHIEEDLANVRDACPFRQPAA